MNTLSIKLLGSNTFTFTPTTGSIVIYVRALTAIDNTNEIFIDNITIE